MAADICLYNRRGEAVLYQNADTLETDTPTAGVHEIFTHGEVEGKTVTPDFSGGDMAVSAASGKLWRSVTVQKPATLIPSNIKKDVVIGGITGTYDVPINVPFDALVERSIRAITAGDLATVSRIGDYAFAGCEMLTSVVIPSNVTSIGKYAFYLCSQLSYIVLPNTMEYIYEAAFSYCHNLSSIVFPPSLQGTTKSGEWDLTEMFYGSIGIQSVDLPDIDMLLYKTFGGGLSLGPRTLIIRSATPPVPKLEDLDSQQRSQSIYTLFTTQANIYVPATAVSTYQNDQYWSLVASQIQAIT